MIDLEYAAGFIDADGCVTRSKAPNGREYWELIAVQSEKNDPGAGLLKLFKERWGGSICTQSKGKHSDIHRWKVKGVECAIALYDLVLHLDVKRKRAEQALSYLMEDPKILRIVGRMKEPYRGGTVPNRRY